MQSVGQPSLMQENMVSRETGGAKHVPGTPPFRCSEIRFTVLDRKKNN